MLATNRETSIFQMRALNLMQSSHPNLSDACNQSYQWHVIQSNALDPKFGELQPWQRKNKNHFTIKSSPRKIISIAFQSIASHLIQMLNHCSCKTEQRRVFSTIRMPIISMLSILISSIILTAPPSYRFHFNISMSIQCWSYWAI